MTAPVDVLAVMDRAAGGLFAAQGSMPDDLMQARAAVAELLEVAAEAAKQLRALKVEAHASALQSAVDRCKGGAA